VSYETQQPRRPCHLFLWVYLVIQAVFGLRLVTGLATVNTAAPSNRVAAACYYHAWRPLFKTESDCVKYYGGPLAAVGHTGKANGAGLIILLWIMANLILGVTYWVYKLASRDRRTLA